MSRAPSSSQCGGSFDFGQARGDKGESNREAERAMKLLLQRYPEQKALPLPMPKADEVSIFRVSPVVISVLDYSKGFGHTDLVLCSRRRFTGGSGGWRRIGNHWSCRWNAGRTTTGWAGTTRTWPTWPST